MLYILTKSNKIFVLGDFPPVSVSAILGLDGRNKRTKLKVPFGTFLLSSVTLGRGEID
jgi:hypothetical protein